MDILDQADQTARLAAEVVSAYVANNSLPRGELSALFEAVHGAFTRLTAKAPGEEYAAYKPEPAVSIRKSVTPEYLICLDDGRQFKSLRRHIKGLGMTPDQYRAKWNLPADYPMVAANYSAQRSVIAKALGLGGGRGSRARP